MSNLASRPSITHHKQSLDNVTVKTESENKGRVVY